MIIESLPDIEFSRCIAKIYVRSLSKNLLPISLDLNKMQELLALIKYPSSSDKCKLSIKIESPTPTSFFANLPRFTALSLKSCVASCYKSVTDSLGNGIPSHVLHCAFNKVLSNSFPVISRMVRSER